jgi:hypothetical protein
MLSVEDWAEIPPVASGGRMSITMIVRVLEGVPEHGAGGIGVGHAAQDEWRPAPSIVDAFEPRIREPLTAFAMIAERVGWTSRSMWPCHFVPG